ncbi:response regulator [Cohnella panacarvi]|uniref:response regulator n=1 Tax=Cohnella panacarvi TaxID=400776 RepID=UPI00047DEB33|nr:helix-turn-helix domain-containing protein [Cohnella panacarvi]
MRRLLIVDDEAIITDGVAEVLGKLDIPGLEICKAYSGSEAVEWLNHTRIDIVVSDIRMPEIDGLELLDIIRRDWPRCRVIFMTGYHDFDAVYQAIQVWGVRYILKTEGYAKVIAVLEETLRELDEALQTDALLQQAMEQRNTLETLAHGDYFRHLLLGIGSGMPENREEDFRKLNVPLRWGQPIMVVLGSVLHAEPGSYVGRQESALAVKLLGDVYLRDRTSCVGVIDRFGDLLWMVQPSGEHADAEGDVFGGVTRFLEGTLELLQEACMKSLGSETSFTICSTPIAWETLPGAYDRLRQMQHHRVGDGTSMVLTVEVGPLDKSSQTHERLSIEKLEPLAGLLESGRGEAFIQLLRESSEAVLVKPPPDASQVIEIYYSISLMLLSYINRRQLGNQLPAAELMSFEAHASWQDAFDYLARTAEQLFALRRTSENSRAEGVIQEICGYIDANIAEDLSMVRLAGRFHFNPVYLSRLFKQRRGQNLSDYIEEARIRKAKALLAEAELRVHEVGMRVGYESPHSFTRFFKKATGVSPQEYREFARESIPGNP